MLLAEHGVYGVGVPVLLSSILYDQDWPKNVGFNQTIGRIFTYTRRQIVWFPSQEKDDAGGFVEVPTGDLKEIKYGVVLDFKVFVDMNWRAREAARKLREKAAKEEDLCRRVQEKNRLRNHEHEAK